MTQARDVSKSGAVLVAAIENNVPDVVIARTPTDGFYNPIRRHSALDFLSPAQFEKRA